MPDFPLLNLPRSNVAKQALTRATEVKRLQAELSRGDDLIGLVVDVIQAVSTGFRRWCNRRRVRRELSSLDARQLNDIGLNRVCLDAIAPWFVSDETCRAVAEPRDSETYDLSALGRERKRRARNCGSGEQSL